MTTDLRDQRAPGAGAMASGGPRLRRGIRAIAIAGSLVGVLDICAAFAMHGSNGVAPARVLQAIASGAMGPAAFAGGGVTAALGLVVHFAIAFGAAGVYYLASRWLPVLLRHPIMAGMAYGLVVYGVMNHIVVPISRLQRGTPSWTAVATLVAIHVLFVGLPISLTMARMARAGPARRAGGHEGRPGRRTKYGE